MLKFKFPLAFAALLALASPGRGAGHDLYVCAPVNSDYVIGSTYVTMSGLFHRAPDGTWRHIGFNDVGIMAVAFDPRDHDTFYTATLNGLGRTFDGGRHIRVTTGWDVTEIRDVCVDPHAPDTVYLGAPDGVMVSTNRADTWERRENGLPARGKYTQAIEVDRTRAGRVLAGCETGIYLTEDAAQHWRRVLPTADTVLDIQQSPHDANVWLAVTQSAGALISRDGGNSWTELTGLPKAKAFYNVSFDATNPRRLAVGGYTCGVMTSEDGGATWAARNAGLPEGHHVWRVAVDPDTGRLYASVRAKAIYQSDDFGRTWKSAGLDGSQVNAFVFVPRAAQ
jgi:photosystem II stability/assembly factor-like uncharacterized protein